MQHIPGNQILPEPRRDWAFDQSTDRANRSFQRRTRPDLYPRKRKSSSQQDDQYGLEAARKALQSLGFNV